MDLKKLNDVVDNELVKNKKFKTLEAKVNNVDRKFLMQFLLQQDQSKLIQWTKLILRMN